MVPLSPPDEKSRPGSSPERLFCKDKLARTLAEPLHVQNDDGARFQTQPTALDQLGQCLVDGFAGSAHQLGQFFLRQFVGNQHAVGGRTPEAC